MKLRKNLMALALAVAGIVSCAGTPLQACDDTLVMLLTAQNPASEFSKAIRSFTNSLTILGTVLKNAQKDSYETEMTLVMNAWLEFSKRYMTNPPEEARNDRQWAQKTSETARFIGEIRKLLNDKKYSEAHNKVLDLSGRLGTFFEAFGVSEEKQVFIKTSTNLTQLERLVLAADYDSAQKTLAELKVNLSEFTPMLPESFLPDVAAAASLTASIEAGIRNKSSATQLDVIVQELKTAFEGLRSHILMREWFPALDQKKQEN